METIEFNSLYKCLKKSGYPPKLGLLCQWEGSSLDYLGHIKESHPESCFNLTKNKCFYWRIPDDNGFDKGLLQYKSKLYLYEIYHEKSEDKVYIALTAVNLESQYYKFLLLNNDFQDFNTLQEFNRLDSLRKPIFDKSCIILSKDLLTNYCDTLGRLKFKFQF